MLAQPSQRLDLVCVAQTLEQADTGSVTVDVVHVVDDRLLVSAGVELAVHAKCSGVGLDVDMRSVADRSLGCLALGNPRRSDQHQEGIEP